MDPDHPAPEAQKPARGGTRKTQRPSLPHGYRCGARWSGNTVAHWSIWFYGFLGGWALSALVRGTATDFDLLWIHTVATVPLSVVAIVLLWKERKASRDA